MRYPTTSRGVSGSPNDHRRGEWRRRRALLAGSRRPVLRGELAASPDEALVVVLCRLDAPKQVDHVIRAVAGLSGKLAGLSWRWSVTRPTIFTTPTSCAHSAANSSANGCVSSHRATTFPLFCAAWTLRARRTPRGDALGHPRSSGHGLSHGRLSRRRRPQLSGPRRERDAGERQRLAIAARQHHPRPRRRGPPAHLCRRRPSKSFARSSISSLRPRRWSTSSTSSRAI